MLKNNLFKFAAVLCAGLIVFTPAMTYVSSTSDPTVDQRAVILPADVDYVSHEVLSEKPCCDDLPQVPQLFTIEHHVDCDVTCSHECEEEQNMCLDTLDEECDCCDVEWPTY